jgi:hypothetical protein
MTAAQLRDLAVAIRESREANVLTAAAAADFEEITRYGNIQAAVETLADERQADEDEAAAATAAEAAAAEAAATAAAEAEAEAAAAAEAATAAEAAAAAESTTSAGAGATVTTSLGVATTETTIVPAVPPVTTLAWRSTGNFKGPRADEPFADQRELCDALLDAANTIVKGGDKKHVVATMPVNFGDVAPLDFDNPYANLARFDDPVEIQAAYAPLTPLYDFGFNNRTDRPVAQGIPRFPLPATRGGFKVMPSPTLDDVDSGWGQWTFADDANINAVKEACSRITPVSPVDYEFYALYKCLTVRHMLQMTWPELVATWQNRLHAQAARYGDVLLLEQMANACDTIDVQRNYGYGASISLPSIILNYIALYQETERWDAPMFDAWMPRWLKLALKTDIMRQRRTDGGRNRIPTDGEIDGLFADVGVTPHWMIDRPSWVTSIPPIATAGDLNFYPSSIEILIHKRGKFALMDRGELSIGVAPNNQYRVGDDLMKNQVTFFWESFEGLIDVDQRPGAILQIDGACFNGAQIADVVMACEGQHVDGGGALS